jgi:hypothetical protein
LTECALAAPSSRSVGRLHPQAPQAVGLRDNDREHPLRPLRRDQGRRLQRRPWRPALPGPAHQQEPHGCASSRQRGLRRSTTWSRADVQHALCQSPPLHRTRSAMNCSTCTTTASSRSTGPTFGTTPAPRYAWAAVSRKSPCSRLRARIRLADPGRQPVGRLRLVAGGPARQLRHIECTSGQSAPSRLMTDGAPRLMTAVLAPDRRRCRRASAAGPSSASRATRTARAGPRPSRPSTTSGTAARPTRDRSIGCTNESVVPPCHVACPS